MVMGCHSLRRRVERLRRSVYPPKMVQLCVWILYARKPTYKILNVYEKFTLVGLCFTKNAREVSSSGKGDLGFIIHTKLYARSLCFTLMQRIGKKRTLLQFQHPNFVCFDALQGKLCAYSHP